MEIKTIAISVSELKKDMYVCALDRPWTDTPFQMQGFTIKSESDFDLLKKYCKFVYIDQLTLPQGYSPKLHQPKGPATSQSLAQEIPKREQNKYTKTTDFEDELEQAKEIKKQFSSTVSELFSDISQSKPLDYEQIKRSIDPMVNSVIRNPDAMIWLARLKSKDNYIYQHAMSVSIWSTALARQLGLPLAEIKELATGAVLADIGKVKLPEKLLNKSGRLSDEEFELFKKHAKEGFDILSASQGVSQVVKDIILFHHERHSGNGYPEGLSGCQIPLMARIVGIVDCYDAIISPRPYATQISSSEAVRKLYDWRDSDFQHELVEEFIQSIGIYPAGSLVELSDDSVAIVVATGREQRLRPKVVKVLDPQKNKLNSLNIIDMVKILNDDNGNPLTIKKSLASDAYGVDPEEYYI
jgi:putative nucleotidyltransferase with HDIG domain